MGDLTQNMSGGVGMSQDDVAQKIAAARQKILAAAQSNPAVQQKIMQEIAVDPGGLVAQIVGSPPATPQPMVPQQSRADQYDPNALDPSSLSAEPKMSIGAGRPVLGAGKLPTPRSYRGIMPGAAGMAMGGLIPLVERNPGTLDDAARVMSKSVPGDYGWEEIKGLGEWLKAKSGLELNRNQGNAPAQQQMQMPEFKDQVIKTGSWQRITEAGNKPGIENRLKKLADERLRIERHKATVMNSLHNKFRDQDKAFAKWGQEYLETKTAELNSQFESLSDEWKKVKPVNPDQWWSNRSVGAKIAAVLGVAAGGFLKGHSGGQFQNNALNIINTAISRDIQAQLENIRTQKEGLRERGANLRTMASVKRSSWDKIIRMKEIGMRDTLGAQLMVKGNHPLIIDVGAKLQHIAAMERLALFENKGWQQKQGKTVRGGTSRTIPAAMQKAAWLKAQRGNLARPPSKFLTADANVSSVVAKLGSKISQFSKLSKAHGFMKYWPQSASSVFYREAENMAGDLRKAYSDIGAMTDKDEARIQKIGKPKLLDRDESWGQVALDTIRDLQRKQAIHRKTHSGYYDMSRMPPLAEPELPKGFKAKLKRYWGE